MDARNVTEKTETDFLIGTFFEKLEASSQELKTFSKKSLSVGFIEDVHLF